MLLATCKYGHTLLPKQPGKSGHVLGFTGHVCITGRIGDREGSFVVEDTGMGTAEKASGTWKIIADSAAGDPVGLQGEGAWMWEKGNKNVADTLSYEL